ncbi:hypothetical protein D3C71_932310 [compost metagenome]
MAEAAAHQPPERPGPLWDGVGGAQRPPPRGRPALPEPVAGSPSAQPAGQPVAGIHPHGPQRTPDRNCAPAGPQRAGQPGLEHLPGGTGRPRSHRPPGAGVLPDAGRHSRRLGRGPPGSEPPGAGIARRPADCAGPGATPDLPRIHAPRRHCPAGAAGRARRCGQGGDRKLAQGAGLDGQSLGRHPAVPGIPARQSRRHGCADAPGASPEPAKTVPGSFRPDGRPAAPADDSRVPGPGRWRAGCCRGRISERARIPSHRR